MGNRGDLLRASPVSSLVSLVWNTEIYIVRICDTIVTVLWESILFYVCRILVILRVLCIYMRSACEHDCF